MKSGPLLVLTLLLAASCAGRTNSQPNHDVNSNQSARPTAESAQLAPSEVSQDSEEAEKDRDVPPEFREVDFKNFSYPISWKRMVIRLEDGEYEYYEHKKLESNGWFKLGGVRYADVTGDGKQEAVVTVGWVDCGASCDGGSSLIYVYSGRRNKPALFWHIETGSHAYGCGLKSLVVNGRNITLELFTSCHFEGMTFRSERTEEMLGKFGAKTYTRFDFESGGKGVVLKGREVFPFPQGDTKNYPSEISVSDD
jgi:hypothetical protein